MFQLLLELAQEDRLVHHSAEPRVRDVRQVAQVGQAGTELLLACHPSRAQRRSLRELILDRHRADRRRDVPIGAEQCATSCSRRVNRR